MFFRQMINPSYVVILVFVEKAVGSVGRDFFFLEKLTIDYCFSCGMYISFHDNI